MSSTSEDELDLLTPSKRRRLAGPRSSAANKRQATSPGTTISRRSGRAIRKPKAFDEAQSSSDSDDVSGIVEDEEEEDKGRPRRSARKSKAQSDHDDEEEQDGDEGGRRRPRRRITPSKMLSPVLLSKASQSRSSRFENRASPTPKSRTPTSAVKDKRLPRKRYSSPPPKPEPVVASAASIKGKAKATAPSRGKKSKAAFVKDEGASTTPSKMLQAALAGNADADAGEPSFIKPTSADAFFSIHAPKTAARKARDQTSNNLVTSSWPSLSSTAISRFSKALADGSIPGHGADLALKPSSYRPLWDKWLALASSNHSIAFHGVGSMRAPLEAFLQSVAQRGIAGAVVLKGEMGGRIEEAMTACERYAGMTATLDAAAGRKAGAGALARAQRIADAFGASSSHRLFLLVYDLAAPHLLSTRSQTLLGILSRAPNLHLLGTVSHISADSLAGMAGPASPRWVWQDLTTFATPLDEMLVTRHGGGGLARLAGLPKPLSLSSGVVTASTSLAAAIDDTTEETGTTTATTATTGGDGGPAGPVLKSVTSRSRKVFMLVAQYQLEALSERQGSGGASSIKPETLAMPYSKLKEQAARTAFINDMTMRSLLGEHLEHEFIRVAMPSASGGMETWNGFAGVGTSGEASQAHSQSQAVPGNQSHSYRAIPEHASLYLALTPDEIRSAVALCKRLPQH